jgi:hypothetical protein
VVKVSVAFPPSEGPAAKKFPTVEIGGAVLVGNAAVGVLAASTSPPERVATPVNPRLFRVNNGEPVAPVPSSKAALAMVGVASIAAAARKITLFFTIASSQNE